MEAPPKNGQGQPAAWAPASCQAPMEDKYRSLDNKTKYMDRRPMGQYIYEASILVVQECTVLGYWEHGHSDWLGTQDWQSPGYQVGNVVKLKAT